jgi:hypothetical protein
MGRKRPWVNLRFNPEFSEKEENHEKLTGIFLVALYDPFRVMASPVRDHTDLDTPQSVGLLWTRDRPVAETFT